MSENIPLDTIQDDLEDEALDRTEGGKFVCFLSDRTARRTFPPVE